MGNVGGIYITTTKLKMKKGKVPVEGITKREINI